MAPTTVAITIDDTELAKLTAVIEQFEEAVERMARLVAALTESCRCNDAIGRC